MAGTDSQEEQGNVEDNSGTGGAAFELQLRLDAGEQVLTDRALRRMLSGGVAAPPKLQRSQSALQASTGRGSITLPGKISRLASELDIGSGGKHAGTELVFGPDAQAPVETLDGLACSICLNDSDMLKAFSGSASRFCGNLDCTLAFCKPCFGQYAAGKVTDALHFAPPILCPGCRHRVPTDAWITLVEDAVRVRYHTNAASLLSIRCPECDGVSSLLPEFDAGAADRAKRSPADSLPGLDAKHRAKASMACLAFSKGQITADKMCEVLISGIKSTEKAGRLPPDAVKLVASALRMIKDVERRVSLQLACLRRFPKIRTPCCDRKMCFKCKVDGWHGRMTCEQRQQRFISTEGGVQSCPACGVPTQRTEGCLQVQCVCGHSWQWEDGDDGDGDADGRVPLMLGAFSAPVYSPAGADGSLSTTNELVQALLQFRASLEAVDSSDGTGAVHFASMQLPDSKRNADPRCNDSSRLEVLLKLRDEGLVTVDFDSAVVDDEGDEITPLSVAINQGNLAAADFLAKHGATLRESVVRELTSAAMTMTLRPLVEIIQPLFDRLSARINSMEFLLLWLCFCKYEEAEAILPSLFPAESAGAEAPADTIHMDEEKLIDVTFAFLRGQWAVADGPVSDQRTQDMEDSLRGVMGGADRWDGLRKQAATRFLLAAVANMKFQRPDANVLSMARAAIAFGADPDAAGEDGTSALKSALEYENAELFELLLSAGATVDLDETEGTLGESMIKAKQLSPATATAKAITKALAAKVSEDGDLQPPLWLCVQLGLTQRSMKLLDSATSSGPAKSKSKRHAKRQKEQQALDCHVAIAFLRAVLMELIDDSTAQAAEGLFKSRVGPETWTTWRQQSATALMLLEIRQAFNAERNPDAAMLRRLLADFGADANGVPDDLKDELQEHAMAHGDEQEFHRTPLMQLCTNTYCSPESIRSLMAMLTEFGADPEKLDEDEDNCLCFAFLNYNLVACEILLNSRIQLQWTALQNFQSWVHPGHVGPLAPLLMARFQRNDLGDIPGWMRIQFGLWEEGDTDTLNAMIVTSNEDAEADELVRALLLGRLSSCCDGHQFVEDILCNVLGREGYTTMKRQAANDLLRSEFEGAISGHWEVDVEFVCRLLEMGANANALVSYRTDDDEEENDSDSDNDSGSSNDDGSAPSEDESGRSSD